MAKAKTPKIEQNPTLEIIVARNNNFNKMGA